MFLLDLLKGYNGTTFEAEAGMQRSPEWVSWIPGDKQDVEDMMQKTPKQVSKKCPYFL